MAMFSEGGLTSPDIWIVIIIIHTASISVLLNPLVFRHNIRKKRSIARDLYMALCTTDFLCCIVLPITLSVGILRRKETHCFQQHNITFCQEHYYHYNRTATTVEKAVGSVTWYLVFSPQSITCVLAMSRWYQISYPLRVLNRTAVEMSLAVLCSLQAAYFPFMLFHDSPKGDTQMKINIQSVWNTTPLGKILSSVPIEGCVALLLISLSIIASSLTIWNIVHSHDVPGNTEDNARRLRKLRSTVKITLLNAGSVVYGGTVTAVLLTDPESQTFRILQSVVFSVLPIVVSTYDPIIYTVLTKGTLSYNSRVHGRN